MRSIKCIITGIRELNLFSTITFPFKKAVRFPILIFGKISIKNARKGKMVFNCPLKTGTLQIGKVWFGIS